ncbi:hypothetical protein N7539_008787 [Penicillium diatomitis]|uniref:FAD-binding PCMH-type domain-containing protein n=1 Tax=Penicillium diatomitis TaxID=2819901 RepID=A0A9W9WQN4_9EURO|nr:uncharacterized protein N7539_008787 [Penicillium diatomitis]KAJ5471844.1 hypothetical protein N7539_008787 [Penicillium diatomitis]
MDNVDSLKSALRQRAMAASSSKQPLSDVQYSAGFDIFLQGTGWTIYQDFIIPQLVELLTPLFNARARISVLEIGPGPKSVLGYLPCSLKRKIRRFAAFEPNILFANALEKWFSPGFASDPPFPCLDDLPDIRRAPFILHGDVDSNAAKGAHDNDEKYDVILFCHSMYGLNPKTKYIERALDILVNQPEEGLVIVFHRDGQPNFDGLACHRTACFPTGAVCVPNDDNILDCFASFVAGYVLHERDADTTIRVDWRDICRRLSRRADPEAKHLIFGSPTLMIAFNNHSTAVQELATYVPLSDLKMPIKNWEARFHRPASVVRPTEIQQVQTCVQWAIQHKTGLTVIGGSHSGHCLWPHIVAIDMSVFDEIHICRAGDGEAGSSLDCQLLIVAGAGCKTGDVVRQAMAAGVTVPLGARPSVGAGMWIQGGLGHLTRLYGLTCDAIVGAIVVGVDSGRVLCVGDVPAQHRPAGAVRPENEIELLWALRGAGTNVGIVISLTFKTFPVPTYRVRTWNVPLEDGNDARLKLQKFGEAFAGCLPTSCSADAYLYWQMDQMYLGVTIFETSTSGDSLRTFPSMPGTMEMMLGLEESLKSMNSLELFEAEMYMSRMHGGHGGGKTSSFKRCLFLKGMGARNITDILVKAIEDRPSPLCYIHLLHGGGAARDVAIDSTAFGCRDWEYACVITGVWLRDHDSSEIARDVVEWVYHVVDNLLPLSRGVYGADLGPDPRDLVLSSRAFGSNRRRLAYLKQAADPYNVLSYACPLPKAETVKKLVILITGEHGAGKDYCADAWASAFAERLPCGLMARAISISDATKREYAAAVGADLGRLLQDRTYKERHRSALTVFYHDQVRQRPQLPEEHFLDVVHDAVDADVLLITGMTDEAPVYVRASNETRNARRGCSTTDSGGCSITAQGHFQGFASLVSNHTPTFFFDNDETGDKRARQFAEKYLLPLISEDIERLAQMVGLVHDFPRPRVDFRHVLNVSQQPGGLELCTSLLRLQLPDRWPKIDTIVCCEAGGFVFASALASRVGVPLALIREAGKLPPPIISVSRSASHISSPTPMSEPKERHIEMGLDVIPPGASVVVIDDVLATANTMLAVLQLLSKTNACADVKVLVVAEFPINRGRGLLRQHGYGGVSIQSLLVFDGA